MLMHIFAATDSPYCENVARENCSAMAIETVL